MGLINLHQALCVVWRSYTYRLLQAREEVTDRSG